MRGLRDGPAGINESGDNHVPQPADGAGQARDLDGGFEEGLPEAFCFVVEKQALGPDDLHWANDGECRGSALGFRNLAN